MKNLPKTGYDLQGIAAAIDLKTVGNHCLWLENSGGLEEIHFQRLIDRLLRDQPIDSENQDGPE